MQGPQGLLGLSPVTSEGSVRLTAKGGELKGPEAGACVCCGFGLLMTFRWSDRQDRAAGPRAEQEGPSLVPAGLL